MPASALLRVLPPGGSTATITRFSSGRSDRLTRVASSNSLLQSAPSKSSRSSASSSCLPKRVLPYLSRKKASVEASRLFALSDVLALLTTVDGAANICFSSDWFFGVVETIPRGECPCGPGILSAICSMVQTSSALAHDVISSHQCASKLGPRSRSGSSAENVYATEPLGQTIL